MPWLSSARKVGTPGGLVPYGYEKIANPDGPGYKLAPDPDAVEVLSGIVRDVLNGDSLTAVAMRLNDEGVPVPRDHQAIKAGREPGGIRHGRRIERFRWTAGTLSKVLRSPALLGHRTHQGKTVRDHDGSPVLIGVPVLARDVHDELQDRLNALTPQRNRTRKDTRALLLGVAQCAGCGGNMYLSNRAGGADYNCRATARGVKCHAPAGMRADWLEAYVTDEFLRGVGDMQLTRVVTHKGYDPTSELREVEAELRALYADRDMRRSATGRRIWQEEVDAMERRAEALENTPRQESRTEIVETGETYAAYWKRHDTVGRRQLLRDAGARVVVAKGRSGGGAERLAGPDRSRLKFSIGEHDDPAKATEAALRLKLNN
ncbi:hypothetical protein GCM10018777_33140 [Streptomyces albogriseolus]|nr:zinc ribbon domain-containing protein [Streptomyces viridodiastaticus]GHG16672.1 hypothetical protein GCM10018777_33140 [Streptomyces viridodiastaticus]